MSSLLRRIIPGLAVLALAAAGCSPSVVKVHGKLIKNGAPMVVSEDTYVTVSFLPEVKEPDSQDAKSYSAKFDQKTGTYTAELKPGKYRTMVLVALPSKDETQVNMPTPPVKSQQVYDLTRDQELDIEVPGR